MPTKVQVVRAMVFPVVMYGCESYTIKKAEYLRTDAFKLVLEKSLESPLYSQEMNPVNPKGYHRIFIGKTAAETEGPILWPPEANSQLTGKDPDAGKEHQRAGQGEKRVTENEVLVCITDSVDMNLSQLWEIMKDREA